MEVTRAERQIESNRNKEKNAIWLIFYSKSKKKSLRNVNVTQKKCWQYYIGRDTVGLSILVILNGRTTLGRRKLQRLIVKRSQLYRNSSRQYAGWRKKAGLSYIIANILKNPP